MSVVRKAADPYFFHTDTQSRSYRTSCNATLMTTPRVLAFVATLTVLVAAVCFLALRNTPQASGALDAIKYAAIGGGIALILSLTLNSKEAIRMDNEVAPDDCQKVRFQVWRKDALITLQWMFAAPYKIWSNIQKANAFIEATREDQEAVEEGTTANGYNSGDDEYDSILYPTDD